MKYNILFALIFGAMMLFSSCVEDTPTSVDIGASLPSDALNLDEEAYQLALSKHGDEYSDRHSRTREIKEFIEAQGTFCFDPIIVGLPPGECLVFVPPVANFIGWTDPVRNYSASIDYAGLADAWIRSEGHPGFNTRFRGNIFERRMTDGRTKVKVVLETKNALTWVTNVPNDFLATLVFGYRAPDVLNVGKMPTLGTSLLELVFINTAPGAPMPDFLELVLDNDNLIPGDREILGVEFKAKASGDLRAAFGAPAVTPVQISVKQVGEKTAQGLEWSSEDIIVKKRYQQ